MNKLKKVKVKGIDRNNSLIVLVYDNENLDLKNLNKQLSFAVDYLLDKVNQLHSASSEYNDSEKTMLLNIISNKNLPTIEDLPIGEHQLPFAIKDKGLTKIINKGYGTISNELTEVKADINEDKYIDHYLNPQDETVASLLSTAYGVDDIKTMKASDVIDDNFTTSKGYIFIGNTSIKKVSGIGDFIKNCTQLGTGSKSGLFKDCTNLKEVDATDWNTSRCTDFASLFNNAGNILSIKGIESLDTSNVLGMYYVFNRCSSLEFLNLSNWDVSSVTLLLGTFNYCTSLVSVGDLTQWNTSLLTDMGGAFQKCQKLLTLDLSKWNTDKVVRTKYMFFGCNKLQSIGDLSKWNVSSITDMMDMFAYCKSLTTTGDLSKWDISKVTTLKELFSFCISLRFIGDISKWNADAVTDIMGLFLWCYNLDLVLDMSGFLRNNKITTLEYVFSTCAKARIRGIKNWNTSNVTNMHGTFRRCASMEYEETDFSLWDTSKVKTMRLMFANDEYNTDDLPEHIKKSFKAIKHLPTIPADCDTYFMFKDCIELTKIGGANTISSSVSFEDSPLTRESALVLLNALDSAVNGLTLTLSEYTKALLSEDDLSIATSKGWTVL